MGARAFGGTQQVKSLITEEERVSELEDPYWAAHHRLFDEMRAENRTHTEEEYEARFKPIEELLPSPCSDDIMGQMDAPIRRIMALPAFTLAGLAVKTRATAYAYPKIYNCDLADADWHDMHIRMLIAAVLTMAGQPLIDGEV